MLALSLVAQSGALSENAEQSRNRMEARIHQGSWPFILPLGLKSEKAEGRGKVLVREKPIASIIEQERA